MKLLTPITAFTILAFVSANHFLFYLKKVPLIGQLVPESVYGSEGLKKVIAALMAVFKSLLRFAIAAFYVVVMLVFLATPLVNADAAGSSSFDFFVYLLFVLSIVVGSLISPIAFEPKREKFLLVQLMHMDAKEYLSSTILFRCLADFLCLLPLLAIASPFMGGTVLQGIALAVLVGCARVMGEAFHLLLYSRTGFVISKNVRAVSALGAAGLAAAYVPVFLGMAVPIAPVLLNPVTIIGFLAVAALSVRYVVRYDQYPGVAIDTIKGMDFSTDVDKRMSEALFSNVKLREKDFSSEVLSSTRFDDREGYAYLNAIFFQRHKRQLLNPVLLRLAVVAAILAVCAIVSLVVPADSLSLGQNPGAILPFFVFIMYMASIGEKACRAMFYNCDLALLRYPFYRQRGAVLSNFMVRLKMIAGLNLITAIAISGAVVAASVLFQWNWPITSIIPFVLSILVLSVFFSTHHLFLYYVFQPYTAELGMKNPFFTAINTAVYMVCIFSLQIHSAPSYFALLVIVLTAAYTVIALILVHRYAPQRFRVK